VTPPTNWRLRADASDWQCDWESAKRFQLRFFRSLPLAEKILAVEEMCRLARALDRARKEERTP
jgi:hypothetical protein